MLNQSIHALTTGTDAERQEVLRVLALQGVEEFRSLQARAVALADFTGYAAEHYAECRSLIRQVRRHGKTWQTLHRQAQRAENALAQLHNLAEAQGADVPEIAVAAALNAALDAQIDAARVAWKEERYRLLLRGDIAEMGFGPSVSAIAAALREGEGEAALS